jgi:hypothetical protein
MRRLNATIEDPTLICDGVTTLALPPPSYAIVPVWWNGSQGAIPELDIELWADDTRALTALELFAASPHALTFTDITVTPTPATKAELNLATKTTHCATVIRAKVAGEAGDDFTIAFVQSSGAPSAGALTLVGKAYTFTFKDNVTSVGDFESAITASADLEVKTAGTSGTKLRTTNDEFAAAHLAGADDSEMAATGHGLLTGDGPIYVTTTGTIPTGLSASQAYYAIEEDGNNVLLAVSLQDALAGVFVQFTGAGTGTIKLHASSTERLHWHSHGLLGPAEDGALSLDAQAAYWTTRPHRARVAAYALQATFGSGAGLVSAAVYPVVDA